MARGSVFLLVFLTEGRDSGRLTASARAFRRRTALVGLWSLMPLLLTTLVVATTVGVAAADTCAFSGTKRVEQQSTTGYLGVEAEINKDTITVGNPDDDHANAGLSADNFGSTKCTYSGLNDCWIQLGDGVGTIDDDKATSVEIYGEASDLFGYNGNWWPSLDMDSANYFSDYNSETTENGDIEWLAYSTTHDDTVTQVSSAWFPDTEYYETPTITVLGEAYDGDTSLACPYFQAEQSWGFTASGTVSASSQIDLDVLGWSQWNSASEDAQTYTPTGFYSGPNYGDEYWDFTMYGSG
jgi:hypothetical protein